MNSFWNFLDKYPRREQMMILVLVGIVMVYVAWALILSPVYKKRDALIRSNLAASQVLSKVQVMAAQIKQLQGQGMRAQGDNISGIVNNSLRENGLRMEGFQPGASGDVRIRMEMVRYDALMQWLYQLEYKHGISILELSLSETQGAGLVTVNIRLQKN